MLRNVLFERHFTVRGRFERAERRWFGRNSVYENFEEKPATTPLNAVLITATMVHTILGYGGGSHASLCDMLQLLSTL